MNEFGFGGIFAAVGSDLEATLAALSWKAVGIGFAALIILILIATQTKDKYPRFNKPIFGMIIMSVVIPTLTLLGSTVYLNVISYAGGPVHWHADFEVWACGNELELRDPRGALSNKIGTPTLHEHDDKRIHLEGVPVTEKDASLGKFFTVVGGEISPDRLSLPINTNHPFENDIDGDGNFEQNNYLVEGNYIEDGVDGQYANFVSGDGTCDTGSAQVQVFRYKMTGKNTYKQEKIKDPASLVISPESNVPPGDCIIIEYDEPKSFTDKLCQQFGIRDTDRCDAFGVEADQHEICTLRDITDYDNISQDEIDRLCRPFFDEDGKPTGIELAAFKPDGSLLNPDKDCRLFIKSLKSGGTD